MMEGDGDILLHVRDMMRCGVLSNNNRGFGKLVPHSETLLKEYLKKQLAKIHDRQQAEEMRRETDQ